MELKLAPNSLYKEEQTLSIEKVATLIGENGSGKSSILQSVFEQHLSDKNDQKLRVVCFSSGQNENFSTSFGHYLTKERKAGRTLNLQCFYYDKPWAKLLIFLASHLNRDGKVRTFLKEHDYVTESEPDRDDLTTQLSTTFKIDNNYVQRVKNALQQEEMGAKDTLRSTPYFRSLDSFITQAVDDNYSFEASLRKKTIELDYQTLLKTSFASSRLPDDDEILASTFDNPTVSFFTQAADNNYFFDKNSLKLQFKNNLELDQLSDGEYQLLFLYALIDLFDAENTLFLLDEVDSHLHYKNVERLWHLLHGIQGHAITTTHLLDSIAANENKIEHLKVIEKGRITEDNKVKQLISRLAVLSRAKSVEFEVCGKIANPVLMDDYNDWSIFTFLANRKGLDISKLSTIYPIKKASSYATTAENFGEAKIEWVHGLSKAECEHQTSKIFLICDKDEAPLNFHDNGVSVNGKRYKDQIRNIKWPTGVDVKIFLLSWKRREIKNYLLSYTALSEKGVITQVNAGGIAADDHLRANNPGDNDSIRRMNAKSVIDPIINTDSIGLDLAKLRDYINLIPPEEISEDITNMYNFITEKL